MNKFLYYAFVLFLCTLLLANCVASPDQVATFGDGTLVIKTWESSSGSIAFTRFIDTETGVICYYYSGKLACAK